MASTPSASALSAVLRCQSNIWTRNPPTKRPATSAYGLGLTGVALRDAPAERNRSNHQASAWEAIFREVGRSKVAYESSQVHGKMLRSKDCTENNKSRYPKHLHSPGVARSAVPCVQNAVVSQLAHTLTPVLTGIDKCSQIIIQMIKHDASVARVFLGEISEFQPGGVKVSITSPRFMERAGHLSSFVLTGWSKLRSTYLSLTALVSEFMFLRLVMLWRCSSSNSSSSSADAPQHLQCPQKERTDKHHVQANRQIRSPTPSNNSSYGQKITEDRPD